MKPGPKTLTPEKRTLLLRACETGTPPTLACRIAGIPPTTFKKWMAKGRAGDPAYEDIFNDVEQATAGVVYLLTSRVLEAINEADPNIAGRLALDALKCYYPQYFSTGRHQIETTAAEEPLDLAAEIVGHSLQSQGQITDRRVKGLMTGESEVFEADETD